MLSILVKKGLIRHPKVIFLDIDGVLNSVKSMTEKFYAQEEKVRNSRADRTDWPDADLVDILNYILLRTDACIVVSSTWRIHGKEYVIKCLLEAGVTGDIIDITPRCRKTYRRGNEIQMWLDEYGAWVKGFAIVDDDSDMEHLMPFLVKTDNKIGLTVVDAEKIIAVLNK